MRLWTVHPCHLDRQGLIALWREGLLARAVLCGKTRGYTRHPQLERFYAHASPERAIDAYLAAVHAEASTRGYRFDRGKLGPLHEVPTLVASTGQMDYEWQHLLRKLAARNPASFERWQNEPPLCHPLFVIERGPVAPWERTQATTARRSR